MTPDFVALFPRPADPDETTLEPRAAYALWSLLGQLTDGLSVDLRSLLEGSLTMEMLLDQGLALPEFPGLNSRVSAGFLQELVRSSRGLVDDLESGHVPYPRNLAEEVLLWLGLEAARFWVADESVHWKTYQKLPELSCPFEEIEFETLLFEDTDFQGLFDVHRPVEMLSWEQWFGWFQPGRERVPRGFVGVDQQVRAGLVRLATVGLANPGVAERLVAFVAGAERIFRESERAVGEAGLSRREVSGQEMAKAFADQAFMTAKELWVELTGEAWPGLPS